MSAVDLLNLRVFQRQVEAHVRRAMLSGDESDESIVELARRTVLLDCNNVPNRWCRLCSLFPATPVYKAQKLARVQSKPPKKRYIL